MYKALPHSHSERRSSHPCCPPPDFLVEGSKTPGRLELERKGIESGRSNLWRRGHAGRTPCGSPSCPLSLAALAAEAKEGVSRLQDETASKRLPRNSVCVPAEPQMHIVCIVYVFQWWELPLGTEKASEGALCAHLMAHKANTTPGGRIQQPLGATHRLPANQIPLWFACQALVHAIVSEKGDHHTPRLCFFWYL